ncbi:MAG TPA: VWA domain-containing protein [Candidatus Altiarchaeales archaeon]|nr:VWA domain-containing protein [Candidatus Altiarchaeales archaeon]
MATELSGVGLGQAGMLAFLLLTLPLIILYILKPKPKKVRFPSVMFIEMLLRKSRFRNFLERIVKDPLLLLQILVILLISAALAMPYAILRVPGIEDENIVIVLDASASMKASDVHPTRFARSVAIADEILSKSTPDSKASIILAANTPALALSRSSPETARQVLKKLSASDASSSLNDAISLAVDFKSDELGNSVYVISDFNDVSGIEASNSILKHAGFTTEWVKVSGGGENIGLTESVLEHNLLDGSVFISVAAANFGGTRECAVRIRQNGNVIDSKNAVCPGGGSTFIEFNIPSAGVDRKLTVSLEDGGSLPVDDNVYLFVPAQKKQKILLLGAEDSNKFLKLMLQSMPDVDLTVQVPPIIPKPYEFDVVILGEVEPSLILPGTFRDIQSHVQEGGAFIAVAGDRIWAVDSPNFWNMLGLSWLEYREKASNVRVVQGHPSVKDLTLDNVLVEKYFLPNVTKDHTPLMTADGMPLNYIRRDGEGYAVFMGLNQEPEFSNFYYSSSYPIFWSQLLEYLKTGREAGETYNYPSGSLLLLSSPQYVGTPSGVWINSSRIILDEAGFYSLPHGSAGVSLIDLAESNITGGQIDLLMDADGFFAGSAMVSREFHFQNILLTVVLAFIILDVSLYVRRGLV